MTRKIREKYRQLCGGGIECRHKRLSFLYWCVLAYVYHVTLEDFLEYRLYVLSERHSDYWRTNLKYTRKWKRVVGKYLPDSGFFARMRSLLDYGLARMYCPGLDAVDYFIYDFADFSVRKRRSFVTEGGLRRMNKRFNGRGDDSQVTDKAKFNRIFSDMVGRKWIASYQMGHENFEGFCEGLECCVVKPLNGFQGRGVYIADIRTSEARERLYRDTCKKRFIIEQRVVQHESLSRLNPSSVNTIRVYTVYQNGAAHITAAALRIGNGNSPTDNYSAGGLAAAIDTETGLVVSGAVNKDGNRYYVHPFTKESIIGFRIPEWDKICAGVKQAHLKISDLRYIAWDVSVQEDRKLTFIEANSGGGVDVPQHTTLKGLRYIYRAYM